MRVKIGLNVQFLNTLPLTHTNNLSLALNGLTLTAKGLADRVTQQAALFEYQALSHAGGHDISQ